MEAVHEEIRSGYKLTKIGWIPEDWKIAKLSSLGNWRGGGTPSKANSFFWVNGTIPWASSQDIKEVVLKGTTYLITQNAIKESSANLIPANNLLMVTRSGILQHTFPVTKILFAVAINQDIKALIINKEFEVDFVQNVLILRNSHILKTCSKVGTTVESIEYSWLKDYQVPIPPLKEQKAIAQVLSTWDKAIEILTQLIAEKQQKKKALMQQLLTGKKRFPAFTKASAGKPGSEGEWKEFTYMELLKEVKRPVKWDDKELYHLVSVRRRSGGLFERDSLYGHQILTKKLGTAKAGDFLISKMQILHGASAVVTGEFDDKKISGSYIAVRARNEKVLDINFLDWYSKMPYFYHQTYISSYGVHIEKMTFDFKSFLKLTMKAPDIEEQGLIVSTLQKAEDEIKIFNQKLDALKDQKKGLMQQLLTGKKRLKY
ncbi:MAG: restriction endonuclease subunit S [Fulvivirga sp.]